MIRAIVIDSDTVDLNLVESFGGEHCDVEIIAMFSDPLEGCKGILEHKPDVVFLDINLPDISSIYLAKHITTCHPATMVVFITGYDPYIIDALEQSALEYLLKPLTLESFNQCIAKLGKYNGLGICEQSFHNVCLEQKRGFGGSLLMKIRK